MSLFGLLPVRGTTRWLTQRCSVFADVVRGHAAVLAAHRRSHFAADFAPNHVGASEDRLHVRAQEFFRLHGLDGSRLSSFSRDEQQLARCPIRTFSSGIEVPFGFGQEIL